MEIKLLCIIFQVKDTSTKHTVGDLQALVSNQVSQLQQQGRLSGAALAQMFKTVSDRLNDALPEEQHDSVKKEVVYREYAYSVKIFFYIPCFFYPSIVILNNQIQYVSSD